MLFYATEKHQNEQNVTVAFEIYMADCFINHSNLQKIR